MVDITTVFLTDVGVLPRKGRVHAYPESFFGHSPRSAFLPMEKQGGKRERERERHVKTLDNRWVKTISLLSIQQMRLVWTLRRLAQNSTRAGVRANPYYRLVFLTLSRKAASKARRE